jgi:Chromo (CHRromatin Organisation MOdifier) domain
MRIHDVFHVSALRRYRSDGRYHPPPPPIDVDGSLEYEVDAIIDRRERKYGRGKRVEYLIAWKGYGHEHDTWEPARNVSNCA